MILVAVGVTAVDHHLWPDTRLPHLFAGIFHRYPIVVDRLPAAAQDDVTVAVALSDEDRGLAVLGMTEEVMRLARGQDGFGGELHISRGSAIESHRARKPRDHLALHPTLR